MIKWEGYIVDGELVDTYGGDYTFHYVYAEYDYEDEKYIFDEWYTGAKESDKERVYDEESIKEYTEIAEEQNRQKEEYL